MLVAYKEHCDGPSAASRIAHKREGGLYLPVEREGERERAASRIAHRRRIEAPTAFGRGRGRERERERKKEEKERDRDRWIEIER